MHPVHQRFFQGLGECFVQGEGGSGISISGYALGSALCSVPGASRKSCSHSLCRPFRGRATEGIELRLGTLAP